MRDPSSELPSGSRSALETGTTLHPRISVVIPTRDRPGPLRRCLEALAAQTVLEDLEVIVVDDGSSDPEAVAHVVREQAFARLIRRDPSGPAGARNTGAANAQGECICFTDDDCEPDELWAERLAGAIDAGGDVVAGATTMGEPSSALSAASEVIVDAPALGIGSSAEGLSFAPTNNIACRREIVLAVPFDESYPAAAGEDRDWCARLLAAGYALRSEPEAALTHRPPMTIASFLRQQVRYGRGAFWFRRSDRVRRPLEGPGFYIALVRRGFRRGVRAGLLVTAAQPATAVGFFLAWSSARRRQSVGRAKTQS